MRENIAGYKIPRLYQIDTHAIEFNIKSRQIRTSKYMNEKSPTRSEKC